MPGSLDGVVVIGLALLPGALYTWAFERMVGRWGVGLSDRLLRFVGVSVAFHLVLAPVDAWFWRSFVLSGRLADGDTPWFLWPLVLAYVALPFAAGSAVGRATRLRERWATWLTGPSPAPRAWDHLFSSAPDGWIRLHLRSGVWIGGAFSRHAFGGLGSYAAGYPDPQDLFLADVADVDADSGEFQADEDGRPRMSGSAILIQWDQVEYLVFTDA